MWASDPKFRPGGMSDPAYLFYHQGTLQTSLRAKSRHRRDEARQSHGFWTKGKLGDKSNVIAASAATAAFWLLATTFLLHRPQNRYRFGDEWDAWSIIEGRIWESIIEGAY